MSTMPDNDLDLEPETAAEVAGGSSLLEGIKKRRAERKSLLTIDIPSWDGDLKAKYQVLDRKLIEKMVRRIRQRQTEQETKGDNGVTADLDFLIKACVGVVAYDAEEDTEVPLTNGYTLDLIPILEPKYPNDHPLAGQTVEIKDERELVAYLIGWNNVALASHGQKVARWMQDTSKQPEDPQ